jgi:5-methylcytosine-specific restriction endonuclease McrA
MTGGVLHRPTLVLNRHWRPVHVTSVVRALVLVWNDAARVVDPGDYRQYAWDDWSALDPEPGEPVLGTTRGPLRVPEVVGLTRFDRLPATAVTFSRRNVARRDHYICQYCGDHPGWEAITIDHVVPRSQGGATSWQSCVAACVACNGRKADRTPDQAGMRPRRTPSRPAWKPLFAARSAGVESWAKFLDDAPALAPA